jgi:U3 small nucleolar RNA-associated protein 5
MASAPTAEPVDPAAEPTIAERLKELHFKDHRDDMVDAPGTRSSSSKKFNRSASGKKRIADAMSTTQSLVQALHSADTRLLETCLVESNVKVIRATVRRVPDTLVLPLVEALVERLSRTRRGVGEGAGGVDANRGQVLVEWLRNVLIVHLGYLITVSLV